MSEETKEQLSEQEVNQVLNAFNFLEFSNAYRESYYNNGTYFTPDVVNQQMQNINMNPAQSTIEQLEQALANPKDSEDILRNYATYLENTNMYYKRLVRYFPDMAAFHMNYDCINIEKDSDFNSKAYKEDLKVLDEFTSRFDYKEEFQKAMRQLMRQGVYYCILRETEDKYTLQELPPKFCKITGRHPYGLLFDFNMNWFIGNYGIDINMYPKIFKKMYRDVFNHPDGKYKPSATMDKRYGNFVYWHQCSPLDGFWCFKNSPELATIVPYYGPLFQDFSFLPIARKLQQDKYFIEASKLLVGIIGFNKDTKSGQVANQINMTPDMLGKFMGVARKGLNKQIGLVALPMDSIETVDFDVSASNTEDNTMKTTAMQSVSSFDAIYATQKLNSHQSKLASAIDMNIVNAMYDMFGNFVSYFVNLKTKKFKFRISFHDMNVPDDQQRVMSMFKDYAAMGLVDVQMAARAYDMNPFEFSRHIKMSKAMGIEKDLISLASLNNQSAASNTNITTGRRGRPSTPNSDNENTEASWDRGSNELKQ